MLKWSSSLLLVLMVAVALLAGCGQPIFVGLSAASAADAFPPPEVIETKDPPAISMDGPVLNPMIALADSLAPLAPPPVLQTVSGPPFLWSQSENYLVLGTDRRADSSNWRTDTIIVVGLDRANRRAAVLSIPRDLYVEIPSYGYGRINQVDYIGERIARVDGGGPALVSTVLSQTLGIATENWIRFEMTGFKSVVDAVGGVDVYLDCPFYEPIFDLNTNSWDYFTLPAGENHLDGESAYWFVRLRLRESDIGRGQRQRQFLWALREKATQTNLILRFPELWSAFRDSFTTDLNLLEIIELAQVAVSLDPGNVRAGGITLRELESYTTEQGASVLRIADPARVSAVIEGIWSASAMADAYRQDATRCAPIPQGSPYLAENVTPDPAGVTGDAAGTGGAPEPAPAVESAEAPGATTTTDPPPNPGGG